MIATWKTIRVFISSTFRDMQAERDWLVRFVFPRLREELVKYRIHFVDVDLRWGVTSDQNALGVCREVIDECHPRFICMIGGRYGWVPEGQHKSITADEIHYGVLGRDAEKRGHAFFYFRDGNATARMVEESPGDFREPEGSGSAVKLAALKQSIADARLPVFIYDAQWDTAQKRLTKLEAFGERVHADLLQSLKNDPELAARFTAESRAAPDEFADEAEQMEAFIEERTERYVTGSREPLLREMLAFAAADGTPNIFVLTGDPGSGKSAFLAKFTRELAPSPNLQVSTSPSLLLAHFIGASAGSTDLRRTLRRLCHDIARAAGNTEPLPLDIKELITHFQKLLAEAAGRQRVVLVFDALNQLDATDGAHWLNWLPRELPPGVRIVASVIAPADGQPEHQTNAILRTRSGTRIVKLEPLTEADTLAVIEGCLRRYAKRLSPEQLAALLAKPAGRLPLYVLTALEELRTLGTYDEITDRIRQLPGDARALFGWILTERLARDPGFRDREGRPCGAALVEKFAACLGVSRHGLSPAEFAALLDPGDPLGNVAALLRLLRPYLMRRGELHDFYHVQFREAAEAAHLDTPEKRRAAHRSVATCLQAFADPHHDGQCRDATPHALSELPHHQTRAEAWPELVATLENIFFLEAKVTHGMTFDLVEDYACALAADQGALRPALEPFSRFASTQAHVLAAHGTVPGFTLQHAYATADSGPIPSAAATAIDRDPAYTGPWARCLNRPPPTRRVPCRLTLTGADGIIYSVALSPDGKMVAACSESKATLVWNAATGVRIARLEDDAHNAKLCVFSRDGRRLVTAANEGSLRLWETDGFRLAGSFTLEHRDAGIESIALSSDGTRAAVGHWGNLVRVWDLVKGSVLATLGPIGKKDSGAVTACAFVDEGRRIMAVSNEKIVAWNAETFEETLRRPFPQASMIGLYFPGAITDDQRVCVGGVSELHDSFRVLDGPSGDELVTLIGHSRRAARCAFSPDGRRVATGGEDHTVRIWNAATGQQLAVWDDHGAEVSACAFSPDGNALASGSWDHTVKVWDLGAIGDPSHPSEHENAVTVCRFSPDGTHLASSDHVIRLWTAEPFSLVREFKGHTNLVRELRFDPIGRSILTVASDQTLRVWDPATGTEVARLCGHAGKIRDGAISTTTERVVTRTWSVERDEPGHLVEWGVSAGGELALRRSRLVDFLVHAISTDGRKLVTGGLDPIYWAHRGVLRIIETDVGVVRASYSRSMGLIIACALSGDGRRVASAFASHSFKPEEERKVVHVWNAEDGTLVRELRTTCYVSACQLSPTGDHVAVIGVGGELEVWSCEEDRVVLSTRKSDRGEQTKAHGCRFSPEGGHLAVGYGDVIRIFSTATWSELGNALPHKGASRLTFSADGTRLISGAHDGLRVWDLATRCALQALSSGSIASCAFSPDGTLIATGLSDGVVEVWEARSGRRVGRAREHLSAVDFCAFGRDGASLVAASRLHKPGYFDGFFGRNPERSEVALWDPVGGRCLDFDLRRYEGMVFSPDASAYAAVSRGDIVFHDALDGLVRRRIADVGASSCAYFPDGRLLVAGCRDRKVAAFDADTGIRLADVGSHTETPGLLTPTPDGLHLAVVSGSVLSDDRNVRVFDIPSRSEVARLTVAGRAEELRFSTDGRLLAVLLDDVGISIFDWRRGVELVRLTMPGKIISFDLRPDGRIATSDNHGNLRLWRIENVEAAPPIITAGRTLHFSGPSGAAQWSRDLEARCSWCNELVRAEAAVLDAIRRWSGGPREDVPPCSTLPDAAHNDPALLTVCKGCRRPLRLNPFLLREHPPTYPARAFLPPSPIPRFLRPRRPDCLLCAVDCGAPYGELSEERLFGVACLRARLANASWVESRTEPCLLCRKVGKSRFLEVPTGALCEACITRMEANASGTVEPEPSPSAWEIVGAAAERVAAALDHLVVSLHTRNPPLPESSVQRYIRFGRRSALARAHDEAIRAIDGLIDARDLEHALVALDGAELWCRLAEDEARLARTCEMRNVVLRLLGRDPRPQKSKAPPTEVIKREIIRAGALRRDAEAAEQRGELQRALHLWQERERIAARLRAPAAQLEAAAMQGRILATGLGYGLRAAPWAQRIFELYCRAVAFEGKERVARQMQFRVERAWPKVAAELTDLHVQRAIEREREGNGIGARDDREAAVRLEPGSVRRRNELAWLLATSPLRDARDGDSAVRHAQKACALGGAKDWTSLDTLAAAWVEKGDFAAAVLVGEESLTLAPEGERERSLAKLAGYRVGRAYREPPPAGRVEEVGP